MASMKQLGCVLAVIIAASGGARVQAQQPAPLQDVGFDQQLGERIPLDLQFHDETGASVRLGQYFTQRPVILTLVYYRCPMLCTLVLNGLVRALNALSFTVGKEFDVVTVSIDPDDTPAGATAKKQQYLDNYRRPEAAAGWHFLTGDAPAIAALASRAGFRYRRDPSTGEFAHASGIMVLTPDGGVSRYFFGIEYAPRDLRLALVEAGAGRIGSTIDQLMLLCFRYDPSTGRYSSLVLTAIRAGGLLTVATLVAFVLVMRRRERGARARAAVGAGGSRP